MSEMNSRESYPRYDEMTTEQLREILRKHAHGELEKEPDTEELFYIMEVLADRESENPEKQIKSTEEAYETFVKHYAPEMAEEKPIPFVNRGAVATRWMKCVAVVAIVCVALTAAAVSAKAFAPDLWGRFANWTKEIFQFEDIDGSGSTQPDTDNNLELKSLQDALSNIEVEIPVAPTWLPEGYVCKDMRAVDTPKGRNITARYENDGTELIVTIRQTIGIPANQVEKNDDLMEVYEINGVEYFIFSNTETVQAAWSIGEFECLIIGKVTVDEVKQMIDSIR